jgi:hypothetical protein
MNPNIIENTKSHTNRSRLYPTQSLWNWMQRGGFNSGIMPKRKNAKGTMSATTVARWGTMQHDALPGNPTNTAIHTGLQRPHMRKNNRKSSWEKRHLRSRRQQ